LTLAAGYRVTTLCGSIRPNYSGTDDYNEILIRMLRRQGVDAASVDIGRWTLSQLPRLLRAVGQARPDAIVMQYPTDSFGHSLLPQAFAAIQTIAPLVVILHEFAFAHPLRRLAVGGLLLRAASVVATADSEAMALRRWYPWAASKIQVIPIASNVPGRDWCPDTMPTVVTFGQIRPDKGLEDFLMCQELLQRQFPDLRFVIIGSMVPQWSDYFVKIETECRRRGITILTGLSDYEVAEQLSKASLALMPITGGVSFRRGSFLAAAACGVPIAAQTGPDTPPALQSILPEAATRERLVAIASDILEQRSAREAAHERSVKISALASWDLIIPRYLAVLEALKTASKPAIVPSRRLL